MKILRRGGLLACAGIAAFLILQPIFARAGVFEEGVDLFQGAHYRWALEKFIQATDMAPRDPERQWYLAECYRLLDDGSAAAQVYRRILQLAPQSPQAAAARQALESLGEPNVATYQIPFKRQGSAILVPGKLNGQVVGLFILDTGATFTLINSAVADTLGIRKGDGSVRLNTASSTIQVPLSGLEDIDVGGAVAHHVPAVVHDLPNMPPAIIGLLGLSFLERFRVNLDLTSGLLILESGK